MSFIRSFKYYYVLSLLNNAFFLQLYSNNSRKTKQEVQQALGLNYEEFKPDNSGCGKFPYTYDESAIYMEHKY